MNKLFSALTFLLVLVLAITAELWASSLTGVALAALGLLAAWLCGRAANAKA